MAHVRWSDAMNGPSPRLVLLRAIVAAALAGTLLAATAGAAAAQARGQGAGQGPGQRGQGPALLLDSLPDAGPIELLLARADSLHLSPPQVRALQQIAAALRQRNAPLVARLVETRRELQPLIGLHPREMTPAQRQHFAQHAGRARPVMQQVRRNNVQAMARVGAVLTPEQKVQVRIWLLESGMVDALPPGPPPGPLRQRLRGGGNGGAGGNGGGEGPRP
jgi:hypothetical protein